MAATPSAMIALGTKAPDFTLPDTVSGQMMSLSELKSDQATVVMFICNHCPYVRHINSELVKFGNDYKSKGVSLVAISSNDVKQYPDDGPEAMKEVAESLGYPFPYLFDETQEVARAYNAACTPDFYIFDSNLDLVYRGQFDGARPKNDVPVTGTDVRRALAAVLSGRPVDQDQKPSMGCNIKWKNGY
jgi:peroxiredoxin